MMGAYFALMSDYFWYHFMLTIHSVVCLNLEHFAREPPVQKPNSFRGEIWSLRFDAVVWRKKPNGDPVCSCITFLWN